MAAGGPDARPDERRLMERAAGGDRQALVALLYEYYDRLSAHIRHRLPDKLRGALDAQDLLQLTHLKTFRSIHTLRPDSPHGFYPWLARIADNTVLDELRKQRRRPARHGGPPGARAAADGGAGSVAGLLERLAVDEQTPSRTAARREAAGAVRAALAALNPRQREAVSLVYLSGLSLDEAALRMGATRQAVHSLAYRGLRQLRESLGSLSDYV